ncbi:MAG: SpoIID/LytB domain-containing protein [Dethiobacter sp.]|nr:SpoIID/LytB domain-containing protein [Dethiobacter sp.]MBS3989334.1 SpoIID/LytB domain-containing protein [Dethiobacter sp.]
MVSRKQLLVGLLLVLLLLLLSGCPFRRQPELTPAPFLEPKADQQRQASPPAIPAEISQGANQEPKLRVFIAERNQIRTMNMEEYLQGVVAAEMDPDWPIDALAAQAIIARTFTLHKIEEFGGVPQRNAHASTDIREFQAYDAARINENVRAAVEKTRGQVLVHNNQFIRAWFHAYAGPRTALAREGLGFKGPNPPYIQIVDSMAGAVIPAEEKNFTASFPLYRIRTATRQIVGRDPGKVTRVEIAQKGPSGRVTRFRVNDLEVSAPELRLALGSTVMRATFINRLSIEGNNLVMSGTGYGHGVGMCQWGAKGLAEKGRNAAEIAKYYYRNVEIIKMWN